ncbi:hypothetical protein HCN51_57425 [Nonomuraea sp. FMUSA5-5]|uniref:Uncharacterized protein n=1 Tax=Nonomuraea composti TaxID=2720023 RepID=A0ABX1BQZ9_9ACTN|nr:hypothetical protein [Nonomuraea sp. FMUSA5-5]NJP98902.1 hypothetical protein [Nonomuraea sp. FMUSA5-5]
MPIRNRRQPYAADAVPKTVPWSGNGHRVMAKYRSTSSSLRERALAAGRRSLRRVSWWQGTKDRRLAPRYDVGKTVKRRHALTTRQQSGR